MRVVDPEGIAQPNELPAVGHRERQANLILPDHQPRIPVEQPLEVHPVRE